MCRIPSRDVFCRVASLCGCNIGSPDHIVEDYEFGAERSVMEAVAEKHS